MLAIFIFIFLHESVFIIIMLLQVVKLLAYISDKDLFAEFYRFISHSQISLSTLASNICLLIDGLLILALC